MGIEDDAPFKYVQSMQEQQRQSERQLEDQVEEGALREYYRSVEQQIQQKFRVLTTDTLEQIKNKMRRKQDVMDQEQNINLIEKQRLRIVTEMKEHVQQCYHPHCEEVDEVVILYHLFKNQQKQDPLPLIVRRNVKGLPKIETDCYLGSKINAKMRETHRLISGMDHQ